MKYFGILMTLVFACTGFTACSSNDDDNDNEVAKSDLVGTWTRKFNDVGIIGFKITSNGKAYYNEWDKDEKWPNFDGITPGKAEFSENTVTFTHPNRPNYYEVYNYVMSENGRSVTLTRLDSKGGYNGFGGHVHKI